MQLPPVPKIPKPMKQASSLSIRNHLLIYAVIGVLLMFCSALILTYTLYIDKSDEQTRNLLTASGKNLASSYSSALWTFYAQKKINNDASQLVTIKIPVDHQSQQLKGENNPTIQFGNEKIQLPEFRFADLIQVFGNDERTFILFRDHLEVKKTKKGKWRRRKTKTTPAAYLYFQLTRKDSTLDNIFVVENEQVLKGAQAFTFTENALFLTYTTKDLNQKLVKNVFKQFAILRSNINQVERYKDSAGISYQGVVTPIPGSNLYLLLQQPVSPEVIGMPKPLGLLIGGFCLAALLALLLVFWGSGRAVKPFKNLMTQINRLLADPKDSPLSLSGLSKEFKELEGSLLKLMENQKSNAQGDHAGGTDDLGQYHQPEYLKRHVEAFLKTTSDEGETCAFLHIKIDRYEKMDQVFGYRQCQLILTELTKLINQCARPEDLLTRLNEQQFILYCPKMNTKKAVQISDRVRALTQKIYVEQIYSPWNKMDITTSVGIIMSNGKNIRRYEDIMSLGRQVLYHCEIKGLDAVSVWTNNGCKALLKTAS